VKLLCPELSIEDNLWEVRRDKATDTEGRRPGQLMLNPVQEQPAASSGICPPSASSLARTYALSLGGQLDFCPSALRWQNSIHLPDPFRCHIRPVIEKVSGIKSSNEAPIGWHTLHRYSSDIADLQRGECEGHTIAAPPHNSKNHLGTLRSSRFDRPSSKFTRRSYGWCFHPDFRRD
jgi:hypothetical protein